MAVKRSYPDQLLLRMPAGLRDRIKANAERNGRSMSAEIVRVLEREFPEPLSIGSRLEELQHLFSALRKVRGYSSAVDVITEEILNVIKAGAAGRDPTLDESSQAELQRALMNWKGRRDVEDAVRMKQVDEFYNLDSENK